MTKPPTDFSAACAEAAMMPELVKEYNRVFKANLRIPRERSPIERMVDKATGYSGFDEDEVRKFAAFFYEFVWSRLPDKCFIQPKSEAKHD